MTRRARLSWLLPMVPLAAVGCLTNTLLPDPGEGEGPIAPADRLAARLSPLLAPGAVQLAPPQDLDPTTLALASVPLRNGAYVQVLGRRVVREHDRTTGYTSAIRGTTQAWIDAQGRVVPLHVTAADGLLTLAAQSAVPVGDGLLFPTSAGTLWQLLPLRLEQATSAAGVLGPALAADQFVSATSAGEGVRVEVSRLTLGATREAPVSSASIGLGEAGSARWLEEIAPGVVALVAEAADGRLLFARSDGGAIVSTTELKLPALTTDPTYGWPMPPEPPSTRFRFDAGDLLVVSDDETTGPASVLSRWRVSGDGSVERVATAEPPPPGFGEWSPPFGFGASLAARAEPNPQEPTLEVPLAYRARAIVGAAFDSIDVPRTPCLDDEACRSIGESSLLGVVGLGEAPVAIYGLWAWIQEQSAQLVGLYARPLGAPAAPYAACTPGAGVCTSASARRACNLDGTAIVDESCVPPKRRCVDGACAAECATASDCAVKSSCVDPVCNPDGTCAVDPSKHVGAACTSGDAAGTCSPAGACVICTPGESRCDNGVMLVCGPDGAGFGQTGSCASAVELGAGGRHTCARLTTGGVVCWGADTQPKPTLVPLPNSRALAVGGAHACAMDAGGSVQCWGRNDVGQLATGPTGVDVNSPKLIGGTFTSIVAGGGHSCAMQSNGVVSCWGDNTQGEVANGGSGMPSPAPSAAQCGSAKGDTVFAGIANGAIVKPGGALIAWGRNDAGQSGIGYITGPLTTGMTTPLTGVVEVTFGFFHGCSRHTDGAVRCWGLGDGGQLGNGQLATSYAAVTTTVADAVSVAAGWYHTCAATKAGQVLCWGHEDHGQLGDGGADGAPRPTPAVVSGVSTAVKVVAGDQHSCALLKGGGVVCWGMNDVGQLGDGTSGNDRALPVTVKL